MVALMLCLLSTSPPPSSVVEDHVDVVELNHFYNDEGKHVLDQLIFWRWSPNNERYEVSEWKLVKGWHHIPRKNHRLNRREVTYIDGPAVRRITADGFRETWTQHDPEVLDREITPKDCRQGLTPPCALTPTIR